MRLIEKFSVSCDRSADGSELLLTVDDRTLALSPEDARKLRESLGEALTEEREFLHTSGTHRADGSYVVSRRGADSTGHRKVFDSFEALQRLYDRLPREFDASAVERTGLTGSRRHMLLRHFAEHPAFDCELVSRQPLCVKKRLFDEAGES